MRARSLTSPLVAICTVVATAACSGGSDVVTTPSGSNEAAASCGSSCGVLKQLPRAPTFSASTVPTNGDLNPYGVAFVPDSFPSGGSIGPGDILVANFNDAANLQGTGTTIVTIRAPNTSTPPIFFQDAANPGFSTALGVFAAGVVMLGNVPSANGDGVCTNLDTDVGDGRVAFLDKNGSLLLAVPQTGPWDLTVVDNVTTGLAFVANVKTGTIIRFTIDSFSPLSGNTATMASGYPHRCDAAAFVVGPTGLAYDRSADVLYVASTAENAIFAISNASTTTDMGKGNLVVQDNVHFHGPLGMVRANNGDLVSAQGDAVNFDKSHPSEIVETTATGAFVSEFSIDHAPGSAFGIALVQGGSGSRFAAVDDGKNVLDVWAF